VTSDKDQGERLTWEYFPEKTHVVDLRVNYSQAHRLSSNFNPREHGEHNYDFKYVVTNNMNQVTDTLALTITLTPTQALP